jgi:hypothetical protein
MCLVLTPGKLHLQCIEGCKLRVLRKLTGLCETMLQLGDEDHEHKEGCGYS